MVQSIQLRNAPVIEFQLLEQGFQVNDEQNEDNSGFYSYEELESITLNRVWFPRLSRWMRVITTITNGVPFFPDPESYKFSSIVFHGKERKFGLWLTSVQMAKQAKVLKLQLDQKINSTTS